MSMPSDALQAVDDRSAAVATAPRITKAFIEGQIAECVYSTGDELVPDAVKDHYRHLTVCTIRVRNGFIVIGKSAPMSVRNFNAQLGQQLAYEDAFRQLWPLYAFASMEDTWIYEDSPEATGDLANPHNDGESRPATPPEE